MIIWNPYMVSTKMIVGWDAIHMLSETGVRNEFHNLSNLLDIKWSSQCVSLEISQIISKYSTLLSVECVQSQKNSLILASDRMIFFARLKCMHASVYVCVWVMLFNTMIHIAKCQSNAQNSWEFKINKIKLHGGE